MSGGKVRMPPARLERVQLRGGPHLTVNRGHNCGVKLWAVYSAGLMNGLCLARHIVHEQVLAESVWSGEIGFTPAHFRNLLNKLNQSVL